MHASYVSSAVVLNCIYLNSLYQICYLGEGYKYQAFDTVWNWPWRKEENRTKPCLPFPMLVTDPEGCNEVTKISESLWGTVYQQT